LSCKTSVNVHIGSVVVSYTFLPNKFKRMQKKRKKSIKQTFDNQYYHWKQSTSSDNLYMLYWYTF